MASADQESEGLGAQLPTDGAGFVQFAVQKYDLPWDIMLGYFSVRMEYLHKVAVLQRALGRTESAR